MAFGFYLFPVYFNILQMDSIFMQVAQCHDDEYLERW